MKKISLFIYTIVILLIYQGDAFAQAAASPLNVDKKTFVSELAKLSQGVNEHILSVREKVEQLWRISPKQLSKSNLEWLGNLAKTYRITNWNPLSEQDWQKLLSRVDIVPTSLLLAQAAIESDWGKSRFATKGNNLFGQWCYKKGCGIVPLQRPPGSTYEVRKFSSISDAINAYVLNLNTNPTYKILREKRAELRNAEQPITGYALASGLVHYSQLGAAYVNVVRSVIARYQFNHY